MIENFTRKQVRYNLYRFKNKTEYTNDMKIVEDYFTAVDIDLFAEKWDIDHSNPLKVVKINEPTADSIQKLDNQDVVYKIEETEVDITKPIEIDMSNAETISDEEQSFVKSLFKRN